MIYGVDGELDSIRDNTYINAKLKHDPATRITIFIL